MELNLIVMLGLSALLVFWMVGAHNRLVALRNDLTQAWLKVQEPLSLRAAALQPLLSAMREPLAAEHGALDALLVAHEQAWHAAALMRAQPTEPQRAATWVSAEAALSASASRVMALLEQHPVLRQTDAVAALLQSWSEAQAKLPFVRELFNEASSAYNGALALFPTRLLTALFRFSPAGRL